MFRKTDMPILESLLDVRELGLRVAGHSADDSPFSRFLQNASGKPLTCRLAASMVCETDLRPRITAFQFVYSAVVKNRELTGNTSWGMQIALRRCQIVPVGVAG